MKGTVPLGEKKMIMRKLNCHFYLFALRRFQRFPPKRSSNVSIYVVIMVMTRRRPGHNESVEVAKARHERLPLQC